MRRLLARLRLRSGESAVERGAVLILVAASLFVIMGMGALAADYGWLYFNQLNTRKAAEAAALAGVVHMPLPNCGTPDVGTDPHTTALDIASRNGYSSASGASVSPSLGGTCAQLTVNISRPIDTFFLRVFGIDSLTVSQTATAEQLPPLKLGSDEPYLGEDPETAGRNRNFFVAISGEDRRKNQGDAVAAQRRENGNSNPEYRKPSYHYAFEIPEGSSIAGGSVQVQIYDPQAHDAGGVANSGPNANTNDWLYDDSGSTVQDDGWESQTRFIVYKPDESPNQWLDNDQQVAGCNDTFRGRSDAYGEEHASYNSAWEDEWVTLCTISPVETGIYVVEVTSDYDSGVGTDMINGFSIRGATAAGSPIMSSSDLQVYGLGAMSLWQFDTGSNPVFKVARLDEVYAGSRLVISLWDVSDIGSNASIEFVGSTSLGGTPPGSEPINCQVRTLSDNVRVLENVGVPQGGWGPDSNGGDGTTCKLNFSNGQYNNDWVQFQFDVPPDYECPAGTGSSPAAPGCWIFVSYSVSGSITDRTVWAAAIDGQPIHLVP
ncbi:MAG: pilus assembly protein TadG-related protein [Acidimicrobiia bacterium]